MEEARHAVIPLHLCSATSCGGRTLSLPVCMVRSCRPEAVIEPTSSPPHLFLHFEGLSHPGCSAIQRGYAHAHLSRVCACAPFTLRRLLVVCACKPSRNWCVWRCAVWLQSRGCRRLGASARVHTAPSLTVSWLCSGDWCGE